MKGNKSILILLIICINANLVFAKLLDENGYDLWLRYKPLESATLRDKYIEQLGNIVLKEKSDVIDAIKKECSFAFNAMLSLNPEFKSSSSTKKFLEFSKLPVYSITDTHLKKVGEEGYIIKTIKEKNRTILLIASTGDAGLLYGMFHLLHLMQTRQEITNLNITEYPRVKWRMLNQWDNLDGTIERGYSGKSIYKWEELPEKIDERYSDFARANASVGINAIVINNVNADPRILRKDYLKKVARLAEAFRPYNIRIFLSANYAAPLPPSATPNVLKKWGGIGNLSTADPLDNGVQDWWKRKIDEIYRLIPDFGGFLVKANSEGMPGPQDYDRSHAEGANMLAKLLRPYKGILIWRAFVYGHSNKEVDRAKQSYNEFYPLNGKFESNVILQVKNGPLDFQPLEPPHPLFGAMLGTNLFAELQITQEYLGHSTYLVYLAPMWKKFLDFHNHSVRVADIISIQDKSKITGIAGVSNTGDSNNWTGHHFAQANWYAYGRLAWNPYSNIDTITQEWIQKTWTKNAKAVKEIKYFMDNSWKNFANLQTPYGLVVTTDIAKHYNPALHKRVNSYWFANKNGIGYDRSIQGTGYVNQYDDINKGIFNNIKTCPEEYLLFFHFVNWQYHLKNGKTLKNNIFTGIDESIVAINKMIYSWESIRNEIDSKRFNEVMILMQQQKKDALLFEKAFKNFVNTLR